MQPGFDNVETTDTVRAWPPHVAITMLLWTAWLVSPWLGGALGLGAGGWILRSNDEGRAWTGLVAIVGILAVGLMSMVAQEAMALAWGAAPHSPAVVVGGLTFVVGWTVAVGGIQRRTTA